MVPRRGSSARSPTAGQKTGARPTGSTAPEMTGRHEHWEGNTCDRSHGPMRLPPVGSWGPGARFFAAPGGIGREPIPPYRVTDLGLGACTHAWTRSMPHHPAFSIVLGGMALVTLSFAVALEVSADAVQPSRAPGSRRRARPRRSIAPSRETAWSRRAAKSRSMSGCLRKLRRASSTAANPPWARSILRRSRPGNAA